MPPPPSPSFLKLLAAKAPSDPCGVLGLSIVAGVFLAYFFVDPEGAERLWSKNPVLETAVHLLLILGPPLGIYLGTRRLAADGQSACALLSVVLGAFLTIVTGANLLAALLLA